MASIEVTRSRLRLPANPTRLITKPYLPGDHDPGAETTRVERVINRILGLPTPEVTDTLQRLRSRFEGRHAELDQIWLRGFAAVAHSVPDADALPERTRLLVGAYFMHEYSLEAAALTNPSIVAAPDQTGADGDSLRVIVSLRAVGEGHISSIEFRTGTVSSDGEVELTEPGAPLTGSRRSPIFDKLLFTSKLEEMGAIDDLAGQALAHLGDQFTMASLEGVLTDLSKRVTSWSAVHHVIQVMHWLASSNYQLIFPTRSELSQRVLFPNGPTESRGMEDARFVRFVSPTGAINYYATYTAFDGFNVLPQLIETTDFLNFDIATLNGLAAKNKGIAIFPRLVNGRFAALARSDGESNYLMLSDNVRFWHDSELIQLPARPWELMQIGNAGAPIETEAGWLVMTHGVGPMRQYALGAILLDIDDPSRVIGHLRDPLLTPDETERDGYVPNVVYSCGSLIHAGRLVIAYGASDTSTRFASLEVAALLDELTGH